MTKMQRVLATLKMQVTDRVPFSAYVHSTVHQRTPEKFARFTLDFFKDYDMDAFRSVQPNEKTYTNPSISHLFLLNLIIFWSGTHEP